MEDIDKMPEYKQSCLTHYERAHKKFVGPTRNFDVLFYADGLRDIWTAFEAFMSLKGYTGKPWIKIRDFSQELDNLATFSSWKRTTTFNESITILKQESPVKNMENGRLIFLNDINNLKEILTFTYAPRGNQIHGAKDVTSNDADGQRNRNLVEHLFKVIHEILQLFMLREGLI